MNEATFESHLGALLRNLFPTTGIQVTHQLLFSVRLGHHEISVDGRKGWEKRGRLDVLIGTATRRVAVLELKRPDLDLTDEDRAQGLSYARLLDPMPPLVIVSNGQTTQFFTTFDGSPWQAKTISDQVVEGLVTGAAARAADDRDEAIRGLLGLNSELWADFLRAHTAEELAKRTGELHEFNAPFARTFSIERVLASRVVDRLTKNAAAIAIVGPPLSGKSAVIKQCCQKLSDGNLVPLYVDASAARHGPLRLMSAIFTRNLFSAMSTEQVRQWLSTSLRAVHGRMRFVLFVDEIVPELSDTWLGDLDELFELGSDSPLSIVMGLDPNTWQAMAKRSGRGMKTELGRKTQVFSLELLSDQEFDWAMQRLFEATRSQPHWGAHHNIEYREPRVLRVLAASQASAVSGDDDTVAKFSSTSTLTGVELAWHAFARPSHDVVEHLRHLARAYLEDLRTRTSDADLLLASCRAAAMRKDVAAKLLPAKSMDWLLLHSFLSTRLGPKEEVLLLPRHLELFARATALELNELVCSAPSLEAAYETLMLSSDLLPLGDLVGADALRLVADRDPALFSSIVNRALADEPQTQTLPAGSDIQVSFGGKTLGSFTTPEDSTLSGNTHPWLVLSQIAVLPLDGNGEVSPNTRIIATVGTFPELLRRVGDARLPRLEGFHFHEVPGKGAVPCLENGVVEPIGHAIIVAFLRQPDEMVALAKEAVGNDEFHLAWRLNTAAREVSSAVAVRTATAAAETVLLTRDYFARHYTSLLHEDDADELRQAFSSTGNESEE